jgi:hypothetical protein
MKGLILLAAIAAGGLEVACASSVVPPPNDQWSAAQVEIGRAQASGAPQVPDARLHLQLALEDLQKGKDLIGRDNRHAGTVIALARTEAQLSATLTHEALARDGAQHALENLSPGSVR